jgi:hypothetical protein
VQKCNLEKINIEYLKYANSRPWLGWLWAGNEKFNHCRMSFIITSVYNKYSAVSVVCFVSRLLKEAGPMCGQPWGLFGSAFF